jgi:cytochrome c biogenesis protein CcmG, thiol:disulfide interchange protein DsbE
VHRRFFVSTLNAFRRSHICGPGASLFGSLLLQCPLGRSLLAAALLLAPGLLLSGCNRGDHPNHVGKPAPDFSITDGTRTIALDNYRGKVVVLNFWATWCPPCIEEIPSLDQLQRAMPQIVVLGVSTDEDPGAYRQFIAQHPVNFATIRDGSQHSNSLFGTSRFPETYVIDRQVRIRRKFIGPQDWTTPEILQFLSHL